MDEDKHRVFGFIDFFGKVYVKGLLGLGPVGDIARAGPGHHEVYGSVHHPEIGKGIATPRKDDQERKKEYRV